MNRLIILDSSIVGIITNPKADNNEAQSCKVWFNNLVQKQEIIALTEIVDYEVRRELIRANKHNGIQRLDELKTVLNYLPIITEVMLLAAQLWAETRQKGKPTADSKSLDGDVILASQAKLEELNGNTVIIATRNVKHLSLFVDAREWQNIS
ncbi:type II toxin-antitoxin system VapC family toxin [Geminocystis herdmanii]|uniref:type II toxin-antitoxin system VapC family toxin n=1 Tax=Geminocystis herdmanii TaxID=669359 RepID=UPI0003455F26|nr:hypothetical protein [Geminocystis herdmanii]